MRLQSVSPLSVMAAGGTIIQSSRFCAVSVGAMPGSSTIIHHRMRVYMCHVSGLHVQESPFLPHDKFVRLKRADPWC